MCGQTDPQHDQFGCHTDLADGATLDVTTGRFPWPLAQCPFRLLREAAPQELGDVFRLVRDHDAGVLSDWPDGYTAAMSEAAYYVLEHRDAARIAVLAQE